MAGVDRMAIEEVVRKVLVDEHADVLKELLRWLVAQLMQIEVSELIGAEHGERRPEDRATHRNGYRPRRWDTRAGTVELQIPRSVRAATSRASCSPESAESALAGGRPPAPDPT
jgi:putative transposase